MSIRHIAAVAALPGVNSTRKAILYSLAIWADGNGEVELKRVRTETEAGVSERALRDNLKWLERNGYIYWRGQTRSFLKLTLAV